MLGSSGDKEYNRFQSYFLSLSLAAAWLGRERKDNDYIIYPSRIQHNIPPFIFFAEEKRSEKEGGKILCWRLDDNGLEDFHFISFLPLFEIFTAIIVAGLITRPPHTYIAPSFAPDKGHILSLLFIPIIFLFLLAQEKRRARKIMAGINRRIKYV